jgi:hypothetical protein
MWLIVPGKPVLQPIILRHDLDVRFVPKADSCTATHAGQKSLY